MVASPVEMLDRLLEGDEHDNFLLNEGLEVLAAYRSIRDGAVRLALKQLIELVARSSMSED